ncbi:MAG: hypothetical protein Q7U36_03345 [bacterium]|nr:hypothetical protein [bacterium]
MKKFTVNMIRKTPDFSEVINCFSSQERKYYCHEIDKLRVTFFDYGLIEVFIMKVNPAGPDVARISLIGYDGYDGLPIWDVRGVFRMIMKEVIEKISMPNLL